MCAMYLCCHEAKRPNLKLKTRSKQLLGYLPLAFAPEHICTMREWLPLGYIFTLVRHLRKRWSATAEYLNSVHLAACLSDSLTVCLSNCFEYLSASLSVCLSISQYINISNGILAILPIRLPLCLPAAACPPACLPFCPSDFVSACLSVRLSSWGKL